MRSRASVVQALWRAGLARSGNQAAASSNGALPPADVAPTAADAGLDGAKPGPYHRADRHGLRRMGEHLLALVLSAGLSVACLGPWILGRMTTWFLSGQPQDGSIFVWMLSWWPHAFAEQLNPVFTTVAWAPVGINLAWVTSVPALALVMSPFTHAFGPMFAFNLAELAAPALASWTGYLLCRRIVRSFAPALMGGLCFGFSPFLISEIGQGHPNFSLAFLLPLAAYLVWRLAEGSIRARWFVPFLGIVLAVQLYLSTEVFATMTLFGVLFGVVGFALAGRIGRQRLRRAVAPVTGAYAVALGLGSPLLFVAFSRPRPYKSVVRLGGLRHGVQGAADFLAYVIPGRYTILGGQLGQRWGQDGNPWYFGIPLLLLLILFLVTERRRRRTWVLAAALALTLVLSAGSALALFGARILPWRLVAALPLIGQAEPGRLISYAFLLIGIAVAMWLARPTRRWARWALAVLALLVMVPNVTSNVWTRPVYVPPLLASGAYHSYLTPGETVWVVTSQARRQMIWQAETGFSFRLAGGFFGVTPSGLRPLPAVQAQLGLGSVRGVTIASMRVFLRSHRVGAVLMDREPPSVIHAMRKATGVAGVWHSGVTVFQLDARDTSTPSAR